MFAISSQSYFNKGSTILNFMACLAIITLLLISTASAQVPIIDLNITESNSLSIICDPPNGFYSHSKSFLYVQTSIQNALVYYKFDGETPTLSSSYATHSNPYIELETPFNFGRLRNISLIAVYDDSTTTSSGVTTHNIIRSKEYKLHYFIEGSNRPASSAFFAPSVISGGLFLHIKLEMNATVLALAAIGNGIQQFADLYSFQGRGTYTKQVSTINLTAIDPELTGFEGGFSVNTSTTGEHYGILVPHSDGKKLTGKVVRVDLKRMVANSTECATSYYYESYDHHTKSINVTISSISNNTNRHNNTAFINVTTFSKSMYHYFNTHSANQKAANTACISILDLSSLHPQAVGFRKGFAHGPHYAFLSPGEHSAAVRLDMRDFTLSGTRLIDLSAVRTNSKNSSNTSTSGVSGTGGGDRRETSSTLGGYSGGFSDGSWSCFNPYRSYVGPKGGIRSQLPVDQGHLTVYFNSVLTCVNTTAWESNDAQTLQRLDECYDWRQQLLNYTTSGSTVNVNATLYTKYLSMCTMIEVPDSMTNSSSATINTDIDYSQFPMVQLPYDHFPYQSIISFDLSLIDFDMRGFSDVIRAGRYVYFAPLQTALHTYSSKVLRLYCGDIDIGTTLIQLHTDYVMTKKLKDSNYLLDELKSVVQRDSKRIFEANYDILKSYATILDLSQVIFNTTSTQSSSQEEIILGGYSGIFTYGSYIILVPYRNNFEPKNGQRGFGHVTKINMNYFQSTGSSTTSTNSASVSGSRSVDVEITDLPVMTRQQVPSFKDLDLRGFSGGFASGKYIYLTPFYSGVFSGKIARLEIPNQSSSTSSSAIATSDTTTNEDIVKIIDNAINNAAAASSTIITTTNMDGSSSSSSGTMIMGSINDKGKVQELDLTHDREQEEDVYKAYTGAFPSLWQAVYP